MNGTFRPIVYSQYRYIEDPPGCEANVLLCMFTLPDDFFIRVRSDPSVAKAEWAVEGSVVTITSHAFTNKIGSLTFLHVYIKLASGIDQSYDEWGVTDSFYGRRGAEQFKALFPELAEFVWDDPFSSVPAEYSAPVNFDWLGWWKTWTHWLGKVWKRKA